VCDANVSNLLRSLSSLALAVAMSLTFAWQPAAAAGLAVALPGDPAVAQLFATEQALLDLTNADRAANGLPALQFDPETLSIARERAASQLGTAALSHYDAHGDLAFVIMLTSARLDYHLAGENLARSSVDDSAVTRRIEDALMHSPKHRDNILEPTFNRVAIGAATDASGQITFAEVYRN
jgi:uncharacterized protein YkwD